MSYIFDVGEQTVWSPPLDIGRIYVALAAQLANLLDQDTGLEMMANDYWLIDANVFAKFVTKLLDPRLFGHPLLRALTHGFVATSLVLLQRAGESVSGMTGVTSELYDLAESLSRSMPT